MNKLVKASMISLAAVAVLSMTGCGSDDSSSSSNGGAGKAVDGYIKGARVYLDMSKNGIYDPANGDVSVGVTDENGNYDLSGVSKDDIRYAVDNNIPLRVSGGVDVDSNQSLTQGMSAPFDGDSAVVVSPLSSLAAVSYYNAKDGNVTKAYNNAAKLLGITDGKLLEKDPVEVAKGEKNTTLLAKAMVLQHLAGSIGSSGTSVGAIATKFFAANGTIAKGINASNPNVVGSVVKLFKNVKVLKTSIYNQALLSSIFENMETAIKNVKGKNFDYAKIQQYAKWAAKAEQNRNNPNLLNIYKKIMAIVVKNDANLSQLTTAVMENNMAKLTSLIAAINTENNITPAFTFTGLVIHSDNNTTLAPSEVNSSNTGLKTAIKLTASTKDKNITHYHLKLENITTDPVSYAKRVSGHLKVLLTNAKTTNEYNITIPIALWSANGFDANVTIASKSNVTLDTNDTSKSGATEVNFTTNSDYNFSSSAGILEFNMTAIYNHMNSGNQTNFDNNLTPLVNKDVNYTMTVKLPDFNASKLKVTPKSLSAFDFNLTHK